jgi:hypothetical protein
MLTVNNPVRRNPVIVVIGDYEIPSEYEPSEPRVRRRPEDDDVDYEPSDNEVRMHIHSN